MGIFHLLEYYYFIINKNQSQIGDDKSFHRLKGVYFVTDYFTVETLWTYALNKLSLLRHNL